MPSLPIPGLTALVVTLALASMLSLLLRHRKSDAELLFAVFCGSLAVSMLRPWVPTDAGWLWWAAAVGGCATCNAYWLVARALFRGDGAVGTAHIAVAAGIAVMIVAVRWSAAQGAEANGVLTEVMGALLELASSSILALSFVEGLRGGFGSLPPQERRLRTAFLLTFGGCVLAATLSGALAQAYPALAPWRPGVIALCALAIVVYTQWALLVRRRRPLRAGGPAPLPAPAASPTAPSAEHAALAARIRRLLEVDQVYREPELKVADLAERLGSAEHKVSRAITGVLGERNFNALVNRHRVEHACRLLSEPGARRSVLDISLDAGFASLGPFNRAFKAATGRTPSQFRAEAADRRGGGESMQATPAGCGHSTDPEPVLSGR